MAEGPDESKGRELTDSPEGQFPDNEVRALAEKIADIEETIAVCDAILQDLLAVHRIVKEKGLCDASLQGQKNQADFTL